jgi:hypothetical protein
MTRRPRIERARRPMPLVSALRPQNAVDDELDWFFNCAEGDMGVPSSYYACLSHQGDDEPSMTLDDAVEAAHRHGRIRAWLRAIPRADAGVLQVAYELRPWPVELYDELGKLTGIVARLACALSAWPEDRDTQQLVEMASAWSLASSGVAPRGDTTFARLRREAERRFARAHHAYAVARGSAKRGRS